MQKRSRSLEEKKRRRWLRLGLWLLFTFMVLVATTWSEWKSLKAFSIHFAADLPKDDTSTSRSTSKSTPSTTGVTGAADARNKEESTSGSYKIPESEIKIPYPVLVASLYKSGTTSLHRYFTCGGQRSVHKNVPTKITNGQCMFRNVEAKRKMLEGCGDFDIFTDNSFFKRTPYRYCYEPSVFHLEEFYQSYPNATIILLIRDAHDWVLSVRAYRLMPTMNKCKVLWPDQSPDIGGNMTVDDLITFYNWHTNHVREFAASHPSITYIEVGLGDDETASILEDRVGISAQCWGKANANAFSLAGK